MIFWLTKYALTQGILEVEGELNASGTMVIYHHPRRTLSHLYAHGEGRDWHRTQEAAVAVADKRRIIKINSLKRQILKLQSLDIKTTVIKEDIK